MAVLEVPAPVRDLTGGAVSVGAAGATVREVIGNLEARYPGLSDRLAPDGRLAQGWFVVVDARPQPLGLRARVSSESTIRFVLVIAGG